MSDDITDQLMDELLVEDQKITDRGIALDKAETSFNIEVVRYAAVRDLVQQVLGEDPYSTPEGAKLPSGGIYRYRQMKVGLAIRQVLKEAPQPLDAAAIVQKLKLGLKLRPGPELDGRAINAALMTLVRIGHASKVEDTGDVSHYEYIPDEPEPDDEGGD